MDLKEQAELLREEFFAEKENIRSLIEVLEKSVSARDDEVYKNISYYSIILHNIA
jgi:hypothetical protein